MWRSLFYMLIVCSVQYVAGDSPLCGNISGGSGGTFNCTTQRFGDNNTDNRLCKVQVYPPDSQGCANMNFADLQYNSNIGGVTLKPYIKTVLFKDEPLAINNTVLNITFSNIKWTTIKFRFQDKHRDNKKHCRSISIANDERFDDRSVLYYDCYWTFIDDREGQTHTLEFEAYGDGVVSSGKYYFNIPSAAMLTEVVKEENWTPFLYIEIFQNKMRLHVMPPPQSLKIDKYHVQVMKRDAPHRGTPTEVRSKTIPVKNRVDEVLYDYDMAENGSYYFVVTPLHSQCLTAYPVEGVVNRCKAVESSVLVINAAGARLGVCVASVCALVVAALFAYYVLLRLARRCCCQDYQLAKGSEIPAPTKVLVIYSPSNRLHAECVASFVAYLRTEYGFDLMYDADICNTTHSDPYIWADEAYRLASHVMYIVSPAEETNPYNSIYDKPIITAHKDVDVLLLSFVKAGRVSRNPKEIFNVFFEHSNGQIPIETRHDKMFFLLKDWHKLISYLSKNLLPKRQIMKTERGKCFLEDLTRAKTLLAIKRDDVVERCDKINMSDKKVLL